jgi:hypothetical protein
MSIVLGCPIEILVADFLEAEIFAESVFATDGVYVRSHAAG